MNTNDYLSVIGFILSSDYRQKILFELERGIKTPKQISKETGIQINHVSNVLRELSDKNLAECKTPELRKGRIYQITEKGISVIEKIKKL
jgi:predicted transcriptional regulator